MKVRAIVCTKAGKWLYERLLGVCSQGCCYVGHAIRLAHAHLQHLWWPHESLFMGLLDVHLSRWEATDVCCL